MFWLSHLEHKGSPLAPITVFFWRLGRNFVATLGIVAFSLTLGAQVWLCIAFSRAAPESFGLAFVQRAAGTTSSG